MFTVLTDYARPCPHTHTFSLQSSWGGQGKTALKHRLHLALLRNQDSKEAEVLQGPEAGRGKQAIVSRDLQQRAARQIPRSRAGRRRPLAPGRRKGSGRAGFKGICLWQLIKGEFVAQKGGGLERSLCPLSEGHAD